MLQFTRKDTKMAFVHPSTAVLGHLGCAQSAIDRVMAALSPCAIIPVHILLNAHEITKPALTLAWRFPSQGPHVTLTAHRAIIVRNLEAKKKGKMAGNRTGWVDNNDGYDPRVDGATIS